MVFPTCVKILNQTVFFQGVSPRALEHFQVLLTSNDSPVVGEFPIFLLILLFFFLANGCSDLENALLYTPKSNGGIQV